MLCQNVQKVDQKYPNTERYCGQSCASPGGFLLLFFLSEPGNENCYPNALLLLVRPNCVVIFIGDFERKSVSPSHCVASPAGPCRGKSGPVHFCHLLIPHVEELLHLTMKGLTMKALGVGVPCLSSARQPGSSQQKRKSHAFGATKFTTQTRLRY